MVDHKKLGIYVHLPFCLRKCPYCDFYSIEYDYKTLRESYDDLQERYFKALVNELESYKNLDNKFIVDTIYLGGGTPSILKIENIQTLLKKIVEVFSVNKLGCQPEVTMEINPNGVNKEYLESLKRLGITRLSVGVQSANQDELSLLGRLHNSQNAKKVIRLAHDVGFSNISVDLMLGLPDQTVEKVQKSLDFVESLDVTHVSAYLLQIEKNTKFDDWSIVSRLPKEEIASYIYLYVVHELEKIGFYQYEISNFSRPGFESKHNLKYWNQEEYIGIGPAAHSFFNDKRYYLESDIHKYIRMAENSKYDYVFENLNYTSKDVINEYIMLKLRLVDGIDINQIKKFFPKSLVNQFLENVNRYYSRNHICFDGDVVRLKPEGFLIYNTIVSNFMID